jgi:hypothetical protein
MGTLPTKKAELIAFCQQHTVAWSSNAAAIGVPTSVATQFVAQTTAAAATFESQLAAEQAARTAVAECNAEVAELRGLAGECLRLIRAFAEAQAKPSEVYTLAQIPPPSPPGPIPAPGTPDNFKVGLQQTGDLAISWKCANPAGGSGTVYLVERRLNGAGSYSFRAAVGEKKFIDTSIPFGTDQVEYRITAQRSDAVGAPAVWTVRFGSGGGGDGALTITGQNSGESAKLAA